MKVLIIGGGGFLGQRIFHYGQLAGFTCDIGVSSPGGAASSAKYPATIVNIDLTQTEQVVSVIKQGAYDAVINCSTGDRDVIVGGAKNLAEALNNHSSHSRLVHMSTVSVYGSATGTCDETTPLVTTGNEYEVNKADAERTLTATCTNSGGVIFLRPAIIFGHLSPLWTIRPMKRILFGHYDYKAAATDGSCNLVHVDEVAQAAVAACTCPIEQKPVALNLARPNPMSWRDYYIAIQQAMNTVGYELPGDNNAQATDWKTSCVRFIGKKAMKIAPGLVQYCYESVPFLARRMRKMVQQLEARPDPDESHLYTLQVTYPADKAIDLLGWEIDTSKDQGIPTTIKEVFDLRILHGHRE